MAGAGADIVVTHAVLTTSDSIGAKTSRSLGDCVGFVQKIRDAAYSINPKIMMLCHGGPIVRATEALYVLTQVKGVHGFSGQQYGASAGRDCNP
jgi:predicted TIM-barrel enzyme